MHVTGQRWTNPGEKEIVLWGGNIGGLVSIVLHPNGVNVAGHGARQAGTIHQTEAHT